MVTQTHDWQDVASRLVLRLGIVEYERAEAIRHRDEARSEADALRAKLETIKELTNDQT